MQSADKKMCTVQCALYLHIYQAIEGMKFYAFFYYTATKWTTTKVLNLHKRIELPFQVTGEEKFTQLQIQCSSFCFR